MAVSVDPTYTYSAFRPGAMETAWVMSRVCSVSSQLRIDAGQAGSIRGNAIDGDIVGLLRVLEVRVHVGRYHIRSTPATRRLAGAGESRSAVVGRPHVAAAIRARRTGARRGIGTCTVGFLLHVRWDAGSNSCPNPRYATAGTAGPPWARGPEHRMCGFPWGAGRRPWSHGRLSRWPPPSHRTARPFHRGSRPPP